MAIVTIVATVIIVIIVTVFVQRWQRVGKLQRWNLVVWKRHLRWNVSGAVDLTFRTLAAKNWSLSGSGAFHREAQFFSHLRAIRLLRVIQVDKVT